jgi:acetyl esterase
VSGSHPGRDAKGVASSPRAEIRRFLDRLAVLDDPRLAEVDVATARAVMLESCREFWGDVESVDHIEDHRIVVKDRCLVVRGYRPTPEQRLPALVFFHGGGWVIGSIETHDGLCRRLANAAKCAVFSVEYRLAPEHPFPAAVNDSLSALAWVHAHASELQIDPACLSVAGDSAGGNLAAVAARRLARAGMRLASQVLVYPVTGGRTDTASYDANAGGYFLSREDMEWFFSHYARSLPDLLHPDLAPIQADDLSGLAPAYIATCEFDPLRDEGNMYADRLEAAGVPVTIEEWRGMIHGFILMRTITPAADELLDRIVEFLRASWLALRVDQALTTGNLTSLGAPNA